MNRDVVILAVMSLVSALVFGWGLARLLVVEEAAVMAVMAGGMLFLVVAFHIFVKSFKL